MGVNQARDGSSIRAGHGPLGHRKRTICKDLKRPEDFHLRMVANIAFGDKSDANAAMRVDDYLKNTCMVDPVGGSVSFYDTRVNLVKV